jgi:glycosyltransferase involved in cell wall biosynthesis
MSGADRDAVTGQPRPRVFYVSYDGVGEPLGRSQVLGYLFRLAASYDITLVSFEKDDTDRRALRAEVEGNGIRWLPLRYHRRPPVLSTLVDVLAAVRVLREAAAAGRPAIVHVRSYVPALIALLARRWTGGRFLFDIRGFWADERVEGGIWPAGGLLYRLAKRCERWFFSQADAVVTLTEASIPQIRSWMGTRDAPVVVIPTCVDIERFADRPPRPGGPHTVWSGSLGTWYRFDLVVQVAGAIGLPLTVVTRQPDLARDQLDGFPATLVSRPPNEVANELYVGDIGLCLVVSSFSKTASSPTRLGEYLAAGMPVLVTPGVGDLEALVEDHGVGVVLRGESSAAIQNAAQQIARMAWDPSVHDRCRQLAATEFDVKDGTERYDTLYRRLLGCQSGSVPLP